MSAATRCLLLLLATCLLAAGCSDDKKDSSSNGGGGAPDDNSPGATAASPADPPKPAPVAQAPELTDYRSTPAPKPGTTLAVQCDTPGRLTILDGMTTLADETGSSPRAVCSAEPGATVQVRFEPADGSPGTQRMVRLPAGKRLVLRQLLPPDKTRKTWTLQDLKPKPAPPAPKP